MNMNVYLRNFIRHHGQFKAVAVSTLALVALVILVAMVIDLIVSRVIHPGTIYFSAIITFLAAPVVLYSFISLISQLDRSDDKLRALSIMDDLTDVYNRRFFLEQAEKELAKAQRYGTIFSILALDVDHLKDINDSYGHSIGDIVLQTLANTCMNNLRTMDIFARFGGDEFAFLIPESDKINVDRFAKKVLEAVEETVVAYDQKEIRFSVSMGVKTFDEASRTMDTMLKDANDALYEAKQLGRNCIVVCDADAMPMEDEATA